LEHASPVDSLPKAAAADSPTPLSEAPAEDVVVSEPDLIPVESLPVALTEAESAALAPSTTPVEAPALSSAAVDAAPPPLPELETPPLPGPTPRPNVSASSRQSSAPALTRRELLGWISAAGLFTLILSVVLSLAILASINGGLSYISPAQLSQLSRKVDGLTTQAAQLQQDQDGLRGRLDALETLSGRITTVEKQNQSLQTELESQAKQVQTLQSQVNDATKAVQALQESVQVFTKFLDGLRTVLNGLGNP
jgi:hypothetical protein